MSQLATTCLLLVIAHTAYRWYLFLSLRSKLRGIPTVGGDGFIASYLSAWIGVFVGQQSMIQEGYDKYPNSVFKIPTLFTPSGWIILVNGQELFEDVRKAPSDQLSFRMAAMDGLQSNHLCGIKTYIDPYHINVIRVSLTRGYPSRFPEMMDEVSTALQELMPAGPEWTSYPLGNSLIRVISRTSNRVLVGLPLCRNTEYLTLNEDLTIHMFAAASFLQLLPDMIRPLVAKLISKDPSTNKALRGYLQPLIQERLDKEAQLGVKWEGRPNDLISWLLDSAPPHCRTTADLVQRLMSINLASIHTTTMTTTNALFHLAANPKYVEALQTEIQGVVATYGWTKEATNKMVKLDSFLKESSRLGGLGAVSLTRRALQDFQLSNGIVIPVGCTLAVASQARHSDPAFYTDPEAFDAFRFMPKAETGNNEALWKIQTSQMVSLDYSYLVFGHGRNACPGRFFAVSEIKALVGHILLEYDVKLPGDQTTTPKGRWFGVQYALDRSAHILLRRRSKL